MEKSQAKKLETLEKLKAQVRIGGKGTPRRKKKVVHKNTVADDKKLQATLKKLGAQPIPHIEEVNIFQDDGKIIHFKSPKVQAAMPSHIFVISGPNTTEDLVNMPDVLNQLGPNQKHILQKILPANLMKAVSTGDNSAAAAAAAAAMSGASGAGAGADEDDDQMPELVEGDDFAAAAAK